MYADGARAGRCPRRSPLPRTPSTSTAISGTAIRRRAGRAILGASQQGRGRPEPRSCAPAISTRSSRPSSTSTSTVRSRSPSAVEFVTAGDPLGVASRGGGEAECPRVRPPLRRRFSSRERTTRSWRAIRISATRTRTPTASRSSTLTRREWRPRSSSSAIHARRLGWRPGASATSHEARHERDRARLAPGCSCGRGYRCRRRRRFGKRPAIQPGVGS